MTRFLIVRLGALGDIVHAVPIAAALRRAVPAARIDWLVSGKHQEILDLVPVIDRRIAVRDRSEGGGVSLVAAIRDMRRARYDAVLNPQGLLKSAVIARLSGAPRVVGFSRAYLREPAAAFFYTQVHDPGSDGMQTPRERRHVVDINLGLLRAVGIEPGRPLFPIEHVDTAAARRVREETGGRYALLNPGAAWPNKRWPPASFASLAAALRERANLPSVVLWGPGERAAAEAVVAGAGGAAVLSPETRIRDVVAIARGASVMVSGDTGPTHVAAAVGTPIVGLYGPTRPERNGPWAAGDETVSRAGVCQCHHLRRCRLASMCIASIAPGEVLAAVERRLAHAAQDQRPVA